MNGALNWINETVVASINKWNNDHDHLQCLIIFNICIFLISLGPYTFVQQHLMLGTDPRTILKDLLPETIPPPELDDMTLWQIVINILSEPPKRKKRKDINTIDDAVKLLQECKKIMVLTGAGVGIAATSVKIQRQVCSILQ